MVNYFKKIGKSFLYMICILLISTIIITLLNYFNILGSKLITIFKFVIALVSMFVGGFIIGKTSKEKGWLEGLKLGLLVIMIILLINWLILKQNWQFKSLIYYLILLSSTIFGSMIGISKKIEDSK